MQAYLHLFIFFCLFKLYSLPSAKYPVCCQKILSSPVRKYIHKCCQKKKSLQKCSIFCLDLLIFEILDWYMTCILGCVQQIVVQRDSTSPLCWYGLWWFFCGEVLSFSFSLRYAYREQVRYGYTSISVYRMYG